MSRLSHRLPFSFSLQKSLFSTLAAGMLSFVLSLQADESGLQGGSFLQALQPPVSTQTAAQEAPEAPAPIAAPAAEPTEDEIEKSRQLMTTALEESLDPPTSAAWRFTHQREKAAELLEPAEEEAADQSIHASATTIEASPLIDAEPESSPVSEPAEADAETGAARMPFVSDITNAIKQRTQFGREAPRFQSDPTDAYLPRLGPSALRFDSTDNSIGDRRQIVSLEASRKAIANALQQNAEQLNPPVQNNFSHEPTPPEPIAMAEPEPLALPTIEQPELAEPIRREDFFVETVDSTLLGAQNRGFVNPDEILFYIEQQLPSTNGTQSVGIPFTLPYQESSPTRNSSSARLRQTSSN